MFHDRDGAATYGLKNKDMTLYKEDDENPLLNDFGCYILDRLHKVQNMQENALPPVCNTDHVVIDKYVSCSKTLEDGTTIYRFSKELLAYLKTLVAFSPYYYADDPRSAGNIDKYYKSALDHYMDIEYEQFHEYLAGGLKMWYINHPRHRPERLKAPPEEAAGWRCYRGLMELDRRNRDITWRSQRLPRPTPLPQRTRARRKAPPPPRRQPQRQPPPGQRRESPLCRCPLFLVACISFRVKFKDTDM